LRGPQTSGIRRFEPTRCKRRNAISRFQPVSLSELTEIPAVSLHHALGFDCHGQAPGGCWRQFVAGLQHRHGERRGRLQDRDAIGPAEQAGEFSGVVHVVRGDFLPIIANIFLYGISAFKRAFFNQHLFRHLTPGHVRTAPGQHPQISQKPCGQGIRTHRTGRTGFFGRLVKESGGKTFFFNTKRSCPSCPGCPDSVIPWDLLLS